MSVYKRGSGRYAVRIDLEATTIGGRRRKSIGTFATKKEAERAEREALRLRDRGVDLAPEEITIKELLARYAARCRTKALATKTLERYEELGKCHILPVIGAVALARLKPAHVLNVYTTAGSKGLSPKSIRHVHSLLHAALDWAVEQNLCFRNVADIAKRDLPKAQRSPAKALTEDEAARFLHPRLLHGCTESRACGIALVERFPGARRSHYQRERREDKCGARIQGYQNRQRADRATQRTCDHRAENPSGRAKRRAPSRWGGLRSPRLCLR
jgi:integrase